MSRAPPRASLATAAGPRTTAIQIAYGGCCAEPWLCCCALAVIYILHRDWSVEHHAEAPGRVCHRIDSVDFVGGGFCEPVDSLCRNGRRHQDHRQRPGHHGRVFGVHSDVNRRCGAFDLDYALPALPDGLLHLCAHGDHRRRQHPASAQHRGREQHRHQGALWPCALRACGCAGVTEVARCRSGWTGPFCARL